jgi:hypothetical protein
MPGFDDLYQKIIEDVTWGSESFDKWVSDRSLPHDHLIKLALKLVTLMENHGLHCMNIYQINFIVLTKCYVALGDLQNTLKYGNHCGLWHLASDGNTP